MRGARGEILLDRQTDHLFPTRRGDRMTRQAFWHIIKRYAKKARRREGAVAAHAAARLRDPPAEPRRGPARRPDAARPQRPVDDADLHARGARAHERAARAASPARLIDSRPGPELRPRPRGRSRVDSESRGPRADDPPPVAFRIRLACARRLGAGRPAGCHGSRAWRGPAGRKGRHPRADRQAARHQARGRAPVADPGTVRGPLRRRGRLRVCRRALSISTATSSTWTPSTT